MHVLIYMNASDTQVKEGRNTKYLVLVPDTEEVFAIRLPFHHVSPASSEAWISKLVGDCSPFEMKARIQCNCKNI